jgi:hypothetical protein
LAIVCYPHLTEPVYEEKNLDYSDDENRNNEENSRLESHLLKAQGELKTNESRKAKSKSDSEHWPSKDSDDEADEAEPEDSVDQLSNSERDDRVCLKM